MHGARKGRTFTTVQTNDEPVCLNVSEMGRFLPGSRAMNFSVEYSGVVIFGRASVVDDADEAKRALQLIVDKHFPHLHPGQDYEPVSDDDLKVTAVIRIDIDRWSGKQKKAPDDFPGAFYEDEKVVEGNGDLSAS
jgi:nitroimidazol reductase NimA-like FMN-containing flavoprotein (pyridoxamine 5'-phosphate oxidase superfamily)